MKFEDLIFFAFETCLHLCWELSLSLFRLGNLSVVRRYYFLLLLRATCYFAYTYRRRKRLEVMREAFPSRGSVLLCILVRVRGMLSINIYINNIHIHIYGKYLHIYIYISFLATKFAFV